MCVIIDNTDVGRATVMSHNLSMHSAQRWHTGVWYILLSYQSS